MGTGLNSAELQELADLKREFGKEGVQIDSLTVEESEELKMYEKEFGSLEKHKGLSVKEKEELGGLKQAFSPEPIKKVIQEEDTSKLPWARRLAVEVGKGVSGKVGDPKEYSLGDPASSVKKLIKELPSEMGAALVKYADEVTLKNMDKVAGAIASTTSEMPYEEAKFKARGVLEEIYKKNPGGAQAGSIAGMVTAGGGVSKVLGKVAPVVSKVSKTAGAIVGSNMAAISTHMGLRAEKGHKLEEAIAGAGMSVLVPLGLKTPGFIIKGVKSVSKFLGKKASLLRSLGIGGEIGERELANGLARKGSNIKEFNKMVPEIKTSKGVDIVERGDSIINTFKKADDATRFIGDKINDAVKEVPAGKYMVPAKEVGRIFARLRKAYKGQGVTGGEQASKQLTEDFKLFANKFKGKKQVDVKELHKWLNDYRKDIYELSGTAQGAKRKVAGAANKFVNTLMDKAHKAGDVGSDFLKDRKEFTLIQTFKDALLAKAKATHFKSPTRDMGDFLIARRALMTAGFAKAASLGAIGTVGALRLATARANSILAKGLFKTSPSAVDSMAETIINSVGKAGDKFAPLYKEALKKGSKAVIYTYVTLAEMGVKGPKLISEKEHIKGVLEKNKNKNFVKRILTPSKYPKLNLGGGKHATHLMMYGETDGKHVVFPSVIQTDKGLKKLSGKEAFKKAMKTGEFIEFDTAKEAANFSKNYKKVWKK